MTDAVLLALCTCPDDASAERIATTLVEERLAACANRVSGLLSIYRWQGQVERASEALLLIKTTEDRFAALAERLRALHPYELPEIIALPVAGGLPDYLHWVSTCTADQA
ncbi:MAG: divalent-cation tolerance protein CutA [Chromatiaceae bacterium]|jgi:periplasmic divalent cation tolerance protein|nr:divalent-cation tolerance protein CutA [Chromatiaceae bacterium]